MTDVMGREDDIKATPVTELKQMLECIFDRQELEAVRGRVEQRELVMAESFLAASGIDTESFLDKAVVTVRSSVTAVDSESEGAPFLQEAFDALDEDQLITIDTLQKKNLVVRVPDRVDHRKKRVVLTNAGKQLFFDVLPVIEKTREEVQQDIPDKDIEIFKQVLMQITANLDDE